MRYSKAIVPMVPTSDTQDSMVFALIYPEMR